MDRTTTSRALRDERLSNSEIISDNVVVPLRIEDRVRMRLDDVQGRILAGDVLAGMQNLIDSLREFRAEVDSVAWRSLCEEAILRHDVGKALWSCPLTARSFNKPRGYAGDAELLDHIYGLGPAAAAPHPATLAGRIYFYTVNSPACQAVRRRREILAEEIDQCAERLGAEKPNIVSVACGHLREAELSDVVRRGGLGRFVALDQDEQSIAEAARSYGHLGVETMNGSVRAIIGRKIAFENVDLIYAAGLFDYLAEPVAMRLIERMYGFLRPRGQLLIANFTPAVPDVGYMETFMDWKLLFRTAAQVKALFANLQKEGSPPAVEVFEDETGVIAYARAIKP